MPVTVKIAIGSIILSFISLLAADIVTTFQDHELGFNDPFIIGLDIVWTLIIAWIIWDIVRKKDVRLTLVLVAVIFFFYSAFEMTLLGFGLVPTLFAAKVLFLLIAALLLNREPSISWRTGGNTTT